MGIVELSPLSAGFVNGSSVAKTLVFALVVVGQMFPIFQLLFLCFLPLLLYSFISPTFPTVPQEESARVVRVYHASSSSSSSNSSQEVSAGIDNVSFVPSLASLICVDT